MGEVIVVNNFKCKAKITGISVPGEIPVTSCTMTGTLNQVPVMNLKIFPDGKNSLISSADVINLAKSIQKQIFEKGTSATMSVEFTMNGKGITANKYKVDAVIIGVDLHASVQGGDIYANVKGASKDIILNNINMNIYKPVIYNASRELENVLAGVTQTEDHFWTRVLLNEQKNYSVDGKPVSTIIKDLCDLAFNKTESWGVSKQVLKSQGALFESIHSYNKKFKKQLDEFLKNSDKYCKLYNGAPMSNMIITRSVLNGLSNAIFDSGTSILQTIIQGIGSEFCVWYAPKLEGDLAGVLMNQSYTKTSPDKTINVTPSTIDFNIVREINKAPVGKVMVTAKTAVDSVNVTGQYTTPMNIISALSKDTDEGTLYNLRGPSWMVLKLPSRNELYQNTKDRNPEQHVKNYISKVNDDTDKSVKDAVKVLQFLADKEHKRAKYQSSVLQFDMFVDPRIASSENLIGDYYNIKENGNSVAKGVLSSVAHNYSANNMTTRAGFTMVEME